jgi:hypothetical protein
MSHSPMFDSDDRDLDLIADYLARELSPEAAAAVEERLATDLAFYEKAAPLFRVFQLPAKYVLRYAKHPPRFPMRTDVAVPGSWYPTARTLWRASRWAAAAVIVVIARLARKLYSLPWAIALGLLLGGALGNLTDRIFRSPGVFKGAVVDFIAPKHFAVFNLADSAIVCGGVLIVLLSFRGLDPDGTVHKD